MKVQKIVCKSEKSEKKLYAYESETPLEVLEKFTCEIYLNVKGQSESVEAEVSVVKGNSVSLLESQDIIEGINDQTSWVSPVTVVPKPNGDIRLCVDMRAANKAIIRERHPIPTVNEILYKMNGGEWFVMNRSRTMENSWKFLFITILLSQLNPAVTTQGKTNKAKSQPPVSLEVFTPELMTPIFKVMRKHGEEERDKVNQQIQNNHKKIRKQYKKGHKQNKNKPKPAFKYKQYLLITIVSDEEIGEAILWGGKFPDEFIKNERLTFLLNELNHGKEYYNPDRQLHGEVNAIHFGAIERLMNKFKNNPKTKYKYPVMLLYFHYIPCAHVQRLGYSCSEELMNYAKGRIEEFRMLVAYKTCFGGTDEVAALNFMKHGGIEAFEYMGKSSYGAIKVFPQNSIDGIQKTFQGEAFDCIIDYPPSKCCTGSKENRAAITAYFINYVTYQCIADSNAARFFTELSKNQLKICLKKEIERNIGDDCIQCSNKNPLSLKAAKTLFEFCFDRSLEVSQVLGKPRSDVYDPDWVPCPNCNWNVIYNALGPEKDKMNLPQLVCAYRVSSLKSLCSAYEQTKQNKKSRYSEAFNKWQLTQNFAKP
ncbi:unnamed protein product [Mytilus coruscus]|uniref:Uncharacterized protein n=1 Tax=Mytilus coruscus TaxID=42192 RepID=A0A6J8DJI8_MYTCO|nr:unnamed protein product [Mytilus coruscus]